MSSPVFSLQPSGTSKKARIEIIPLIDVIFFLLATFVLFTLSLNKIQSVPVTLPQAVASSPLDLADDDTVILQVSLNNTAWWNRELIPLNEVRPRLDHYRATSSNPRVLVSSDDEARYGDMVRVLDEVRLSGVTQVSVETAWRAPGR